MCKLFWADQDRLINLLESRLEKGSQQEKRMMSELVKERQKLCEMTAQWEKLKASRKKAIKITKKKRLYSILKPMKTIPNLKDYSTKVIC